MYSEQTVQFFKCNDKAYIPEKAHTGVFQDAAFDLFLPDSAETIEIGPKERKILPIGLKALIPEGYWIKFHERSGLAAKFGLQVLAGVIDNTYTGEFMVVVYNSSDKVITLYPSQAVCQFTLEKSIPTELLEISEADFIEGEKSRSRKADGFGSTDKK